MLLDCGKNNIRILLADDHKIVREGIFFILDREPGIEVIGQAEDGESAVKKAMELLPDVILMDMGMPQMNGIEATMQILAEVPQCKVIILSMYSDKRFVTQALKVGAKGYILKGCASSELVQAIRSVAIGEMYICSQILEVIVDNYVKYSPVEIAKSSEELSPREREVLMLIADGKNTKEIAAIINIGIKTVETYRQQLMRKLNIFNVAVLTKYAVREGLTSLDNSQ